jgi:asparagine synthase (glutamine-hydrolysing)
MCGICGIIGPGDKGKQESIVRGMMERLKHRGPDGSGLHQEDGFSFGHQRLAVIDLENGTQPMKSPDGRFTLVFNGEIYNYIELREKLTLEGVQFQTSSDTEVLLQVFIRYGENAFAELNGMFAFALFDAKEKRWILGRDPFGIKPLYYTLVGEELVFASEIKALLLHPKVTPELNPAGFQHYLTFQFCFGSKTLFKGIQTLEPGCYLKGGAGSENFSKIRYWDTNYKINENQTGDTYLDQLDHLLQNTAQLQTRSDVPLGAYLSGGLDSSLVATLAAEQLDSPLHVFHGKFDAGKKYQEAEYAQSVARQLGAVYHEAVPTPQEFVDLLPKLIYFMDEPAAGPGLFPQYIVSRLASQHVKVVLGGQGGDELFAGYARYLIGYLEQTLKGAILETQEEGKHVVTMDTIIPNLPVLKDYIPLMKKFWGDGLFDPMSRRYFRLIDRSPQVLDLLTPDALSLYDAEKVFEDFTTVFNHPDTLSYVNKMTHFDLKTFLPALLQVEDRMSMAVSLESRVPLLDIRISEWVTTLPPGIKFSEGRLKYTLKEVAKKWLPAKVLARKDKMGFPVPLQEWIKGGPVRDFIHDVLLGNRSRNRAIFQVSMLERLLAKEDPFDRQLWGVLCLELWHREFIDSN